VVKGEVDGHDVVTVVPQSLRSLKEADKAQVLTHLNEYQISVNVVSADFEVPTYKVADLLESAELRAKFVEDLAAIESHTSEHFRMANMLQVALKPAEIAKSLMGEFVPFVLEPLMENRDVQHLLTVHKLSQKVTSKKRVKTDDVTEMVIKTATSRSEGAAAIAQAMFLAHRLGIEELASRPSVSNNFIVHGVPELANMNRQELDTILHYAEEAVAFFAKLPDTIWHLTRDGKAVTSIPNFRILLAWFTAFFKKHDLTADEFWNAHVEYAEASSTEEANAMVLGDFVVQFNSLNNRTVSRTGKANAAGETTSIEETYAEMISEGTGNLGVSAAAMAGVDAHFLDRAIRVISAKTA